LSRQSLRGSIAHMSYYQHHIFFCLNERSNGEACCAQHQPQLALDHCKARVKSLGLAGPGGVRVNKAGCMDRCAGGPVAVVYPQPFGTPTSISTTSTKSSSRT